MIKRHVIIRSQNPRHIKLARPVVNPVKALDPFTIGVVHGSEIAGKGIGLFVLFYCTMNWWYYRRTREDLEKKGKDKK